jgi:hypothetical protein
MTIEYRYLKRDGDILTCNSCACEAPLAHFDGGAGRRARDLCEVCASTFIGNMTQYATLYSTEQRDQAVIQAQVANLMLDKLTPRTADKASAAEHPSEETE